MSSFTKVTPLTVGNVWGLLKSLPYDSLMDAMVHGYHGRIITDNILAPSLVLAEVGGTYYLAGNADSEKVEAMFEEIKPYAEIHVTEALSLKLKAFFKERLEIKHRVLMDFSRVSLKHLETVKARKVDGYWIEAVDESLYHRLKEEGWSSLMVSNFKDYKDYAAHGFGYVVLHDDEIVSGASSFIRYNEGIEVEVATQEDYRGQGLATWVAAHLVSEALGRGMQASWDAANETSKHIAKTLGYEVKKTYEVFQVTK